ncbi:unnamed protein product [Penicillium crustosum]
MVSFSPLSAFQLIMKGPIVRITPNELHIKDASFYDEIYAGSGRIRNKDERFVKTFSAPHAMVSITDHAYHRVRRGLLGEFFSQRSVIKMEPIINGAIEKLSQRLHEACQTGAVINMDAAFAAMTADVITRHAWGQSGNYLDHGNFNKQWKDAVAGTMASRVLFRHFPYMLHILMAVPLPILLKLDPGVADILKIEGLVRRLSVENVNRGIVEKQEGKTIFDALNNVSVPPEQRTAKHLIDEGHILLLAGTETTAKALSTCLCYLLLAENKNVLLALQSELRQAFPNVSTWPKWTEAQKLPYLTAVINECLRLSHGLSTRLPRTAPKESLQYKQWHIPAATPVSQTAYFVHMDPSIFPDPERFEPERWIRASKEGLHLERYIVSFSKGSRQCLGINMAYAEIFLALTHIMRNFEFQLHDTSVDDVRLFRDRFFGAAQDGSVGVRVLVNEVKY